MEWLAKLGKGALQVIGIAFAVAFAAVWFLADALSCVVANPCPAIVERGEEARAEGDVEAFNDAVDDYIENDCQETGD